MAEFRDFLENEENLDSLYRSLLDPRLLAQRDRLDKMVNAAYARGDHETAERLDAELDDLESRMDDALEMMDDASPEDDRGEEEKEIDLDWSPQEEMARIYDQYAKGRLHLPDTDWVERDPSYRNDPQFFRQQRTQGYALAPKGAFEQVPISQQKALADMLRSAVTESPGSHRYGIKTDLLKSTPDQKVIGLAKDAWERQRSIKARLRG